MRRVLTEDGYESGLRNLEPSPVQIVPAQFFDGTPARHVPSGIRALMVAILEDAIDVYLKHRGAVLRDKRTLYLRARRWFASEDRSFVFSFLRVSEALGLDPQLIRKALREARDRPSTTAPSAGVTRLGSPVPAPQAITG